ncbi:MAG: hypothetical protein JXR50_01320 [Prolixibacteraceae bacterium]|nr:hypothetical protein [Prolixibacteraceae bacterium]
MESRLDFAALKQKLTEAFGQNSDVYELDEYTFDSDYTIPSASSSVNEGDLYYHELVYDKFEGNRHFTYPVIRPKSATTFSRGIVLFHGLNEKSWDKYLQWAAELVKRLQCPVILFPIAYHINRAPQKWSDPRKMKGAVQTRLGLRPKNESTFANAALSIRLSASPEQFVYSGVQTFYDMRKLAHQIRDGRHPMFKELARIDFFAYSIGAFLAEILLISNPDKLFSNTKLFVFAGGPTFDSMIGTSRYIMDLAAFKSLLTLKSKRKIKAMHRHLLKLNLPVFEEMWMGFYAMMYLRRGRKYRNAWLDYNAGNIWLLALKNDRVMPAGRIVKTFKRKKNEPSPRIDIIDFPYPYSHENPFPANDLKNKELVMRSMEVVMNKAAEFYTTSMIEQAQFLEKGSGVEVPC